MNIPMDPLISLLHGSGQPALACWTAGDTTRWWINLAARQDPRLRLMPFRHWQELAAQAMDSGQHDEEGRGLYVVEVENVLEGADQSLRIAYRVCRISGKLVAWLMVKSRDGVEEGKYRTAYEQLRMAVHSVGIGVWERDLVSNQAIWDEQMYRLRGFSPDDPRPTDELRILATAEETRADFARKWSEFERSGSEHAFEWAIRWPDGSDHVLGTRGTPILDATGKPVRLIGVNWDLTAQRLSDRKERDKLAAEAASHAKSLFLAHMSHELRTPLNGILGFIDIMRRDAKTPLPPAHQKRLAIMHEAGQHLLSLINDTLDMSSIEAQTLLVGEEAVDLDAVLHQAEQWLSNIANRRSVTMEIHPTSVNVLGDARRICQILINLLSNAVKYNREGGRVRVEPCPDRGDERQWIRICDNGRGISAPNLERLFRAFDRLGLEAEAIEGAGLGLALSKHLAERMGILIEVQSQEGIGSEFRLGFRRVLASEAELPSRSDLHEANLGIITKPPGPRRLRALYLDANPRDRMVAEELFGLRPDWHLHVAESGRGGIVLASDLIPDLILIAMDLPDLHGTEVFSILNELPHLRDVGFVAIVASAGEANGAARSDTANTFRAAYALPKPLSPRGLVDLLDRHKAQVLAISV